MKRHVFLISLIFLSLFISSNSKADSGFALSNIFTLDTRGDQPYLPGGFSFALSNIFTLDTRGQSSELSFALSNIFTLDTRDVTVIANIQPLDQYQKGSIDIKGTADVTENLTFVSWQLYYAPGNPQEMSLRLLQPLSPSPAPPTRKGDPTRRDALRNDKQSKLQNITPQSSGPWNFLAEGDQPVEDDVFYTWDTTELNQTDIAGDEYTLRLVVNAEKPEGEVIETTDRFTFKIDNKKPEPPVISVTSSPGESDFTANNAILTVVGSIEESVLSLDSVTCPGMVSHSVAIEDTQIEGTIQLGEISGPVRVSVTVSDLAGNISEPGRSNSLLADNNKPKVVIQQPADGANFQSQSVRISGTASDSISEIVKVEFYIVGDKIDGEENWTGVNGTENWNVEYDPSIQYPKKEDYRSTCQFRSFDTVGNVSETEEIFIQYYSYKPAANLNKPIDGEFFSGAIEIRGSATEEFDLEYINESDPSDTGNISHFDHPILKGPLALWNPSNLSGSYTIKLTVHGTAGDIAVERTGITINVRLGDVNEDGVVDAKDATEILRYVVGLPPAERFIEDRADVSNNGSITAYDAALILQKTAGLIGEF